MTTTPILETLDCRNGAHTFERPLRRGPKPSSCPEHHRPLTAADVVRSVWPEATAGEHARTVREIEALGLPASVLASAGRGTAIRARNAAKALRIRHIIPLAVRLELDREAGRRIPTTPALDRAAAKQGNADAWMLPDAATGVPRRLDPEQYRENPYARAQELKLSDVGERLGDDFLSVQVRRGAMHNHPASGDARPESCGECFLIANDPDHRAHRLA